MTTAILLAYGDAWHGAFLYDDTYLIVHNRFLRSWSALPALLGRVSQAGAQQAFGFHRPTLMLLYFLIYQAFGPSPLAFHAANIVLHVLNAGLLFQLGRRLGLPVPAAFVAVLLWAVHPVQTEAVTYISGTTDPLCSLFVLLGLLAVLAVPTRTGSALACFALALGAKETAVIFPVLAMIVLFWRGEAERWRAVLYYRCWPFWALALVYGAGYLFFSQVQLYDPASPYAVLYAHNIFHRLLTTLATLPVYARLLVWPAGLHMDHVFPIFTDWRAPEVLAGLAMVAAVLLQLAWGRGRRGVGLSCGLLWCGAALAPACGIVKPTDELLCEHWLYLPTMGLALGVAATLAPLGGNKAGRVVPATLVAITALVLGVATFRQNRVWSSTETLYAHFFRQGEPAGRAHNDLGIWYSEQGDFDKAILEFQAAIAHPDPLPPGMLPGLHLNLAKACIGVGPDEAGVITPQSFMQAVRFSTHLSEAIAELQQALALEPGAYWPNQFLAILYAQRGEQAKAEFYNRQAQAALLGLGRP